MNKLIILAVLAIATPALAAQKAPAKAAKPAEKAPPAAAPSDADLEGAGKVIEVDSSGGAKLVRGQESSAQPSAEALDIKKGEIGAADACRLRFKAQCVLLKRCLKTEELDCDALAFGCGQLAGKAAFTRKMAEECVAGVAALSCEAPSDQLDANPENRVPACKAVLAAEQQPLTAPAEATPEKPDKRAPEKKEGGEPDLTGYKTIDVPQDGSSANP